MMGKPLWDLWKHGVTQGFIGTFLGCREQCRLRYIEGWRNQSTPIYLEFGLYCHWVMHEVYNGRKLQLNSMTTQYHKIWERDKGNPRTAQREQQAKVYAMGKPLLRVYFDYWKKQDRAIAWLESEDVFRMPFVYPDGKETFITGRRDAAYKTKGERLWLFESKCLSVIKDDELADTLPVNTQVLLYLSSLGYDYNVSPSGVRFNVLRRPGLRQSQTESNKQFSNRIKLDVAKRPEHYFHRWEMLVTKKELADWQAKFLAPVMEEIRLWTEGKLPHYTDYGALTNKYGRVDLYGMILKGQKHGYRRAKVPFTELED